MIDINKQIKSQFVYNSQSFWVKTIFYVLDLFYSIEVHQLKKRLGKAETLAKLRVAREEQEHFKKYTTVEKQKWSMDRGFKRMKKVETRVIDKFDEENLILAEKYNAIKTKFIKQS